MGRGQRGDGGRGSGPRHLAFHPNGEILYVINELTADITSFAFDPETGELGDILQTIATVPPELPRPQEHGRDPRPSVRQVPLRLQPQIRESSFGRCHRGLQHRRRRYVAADRLHDRRHQLPARLCHRPDRHMALRHGAKERRNRAVLHRPTLRRADTDGQCHLGHGACEHGVQVVDATRLF
ncbi:MAG: lactonase family protein [Caldilineaceae bacterium]|nr:lactonase family protein [Caldilineaceae bacterium]